MADTNNELQSVADFDVIDFAKNILNEVDRIRSYEFDQTDDDTGQKERKPIESRINAFFRLIGLPMFVSIKSKSQDKPRQDLSGERNLTPGYYGGKFVQYSLQNTKDYLSKLKYRESALLDRENKIGTKEMDTAMTDALITAIPLAPEVVGVMFAGTVGTGQQNNDALSMGVARKVYKKLFPLVTSYIKVSPVKNETARPFLQYSKDQMPDSQTILPKPFIETVIRIRLVAASNAENTAGKNKITDIKDSVKALVGETAYKDISAATDSALSSASSGGMLENLILRRLISSLPQLAKKWYELKKTQELLRQKGTYTVSVQTTSAQSSPFGKRSGVAANISVDPKSDIGNKLKNLQIKLAKDQAMQMLLPSDDTVLGSNTDASGTTKNTIIMSLVSPLTKLLTPDLEQTQREIKRLEDVVSKAGQQVEALRVGLEVMTGEFTGLSIVDVVAVIIALFAISKQDLVSLLDKETFDEMKKDKVLAAAIESLNLIEGLDTAQNSVTSLETTVTWVFNLLNTYIKTNEDRTARSKNAKNNKRTQQQPVSLNEPETGES